MFRFPHLQWLYSLLLLSTPVFAQTTVELKHDDGTQEGKRSMTGAGHSIEFECPDDGTWYVDSVSIHGSRYGTPRAPNEDFQLIIAGEDLQRRQEFQKPYSLFERGEETWVEIGIEPVEVRGKFHVASFFNPTRTKGVYVGIDTDSSPTHSAILLASDPDQKKSELQGDWMIRAHLTQQPDGKTRSLVGSEALTKQQRQRDAARDAEVLGDARSLTLKHDNGSMDEHMNIQGALYTLAFETPRDVEGYIWQVQIYASQFGSRHDSEAVSGDVYILDENRQVLSRTTFPYSLASQQKEWISIPTLPTKVKGKFYVSIDTHGTKYKGLYMGYEDGNGTNLASTDERKGNRVQSADWSERFENMRWMIRAKIADRPVAY